MAKLGRVNGVSGPSSEASGGGDLGTSKVPAGREENPVPQEEDTELLMRRLQEREDRAARKIQRAWRMRPRLAMCQTTAARPDKLERKPDKRVEKHDAANDTGECVLLFSKDINPIETFGEEKPPRGVDQEVQAEEEDHDKNQNQ